MGFFYEVNGVWLYLKESPFKLTTGRIEIREGAGSTSEMVRKRKAFATEYYCLKAVHGHWVDASIGRETRYKCSNCGKYIYPTRMADSDYEYCPNCKLKMD